MAEIVTIATIAGIWVATNYAGILTSASGIGAPVLMKKFILNPILKKKNIRKLLKYLTDEDVKEVYDKVIFFVKELDHSKIYNMKHRIKKYKRFFRKIRLLDCGDKVLTYVFDSLKDDKLFSDFNEKQDLIENIMEMLMVTRKLSSKEIRRAIFSNVLEFLIDYDLVDLKQLSFYIESQHAIFIQAIRRDDIMGFLEVSLPTSDFKDNLLHLIRKINFDIERKYTVSVDRSPSLEDFLGMDVNLAEAQPIRSVVPSNIKRSYSNKYARK